jgi:hypothetical protein
VASASDLICLSRVWIVYLVSIAPAQCTIRVDGKEWRAKKEVLKSEAGTP